MSIKLRPSQYADQKGAIVEGFDRNIIIAEGATVPTNGTAGYAPGCVFFRRAGGANQQIYVNTGTAASCTFTALTPAGSSLGAVVGVATSYKLARGVSSITGSGTVVTGLATVVAVVATMQADASLTNGTSVTATIGDQAGSPAAGSVILKVWKPTSSSDGTPVASAAAVSVNWVAIGT
jgi:hypothetical protein